MNTELIVTSAIKVLFWKVWKSLKIQNHWISIINNRWNPFKRCKIDSVWRDGILFELLYQKHNYKCIYYYQIEGKSSLMYICSNYAAEVYYIKMNSYALIVPPPSCTLRGNVQNKLNKIGYLRFNTLYTFLSSSSLVGFYNLPNIAKKSMSPPVLM